MRGTGSRSAAATALLAVLACLASAGSAEAKIEHAFLGNLGSAAQPSFIHAQGLAVDQATDDILVIDGGAKTVSRWHADGTPSGFPALGTNVIDGKEGPDATPQGELAFGIAKEVQVAVDNSGTATDGNIYVTQASKHVVDIFSREGEYLGQLSEFKEGPSAEGALKPLNEPCGVGVDGSGAVYVGDFSSADLIHKYVPSGNPVVNGDNTANFDSLLGTSSPCTLAAGSGPTAGFIFVNRYNGELFKLNSSTGAVQYQIGSGGHWTVSVDPASGHVYAAKTLAEEVVEYDASEAGAASIVSTIETESQPEGVAIDETSGRVYVSLKDNPHVAIYSPLEQPRPRIVTEWAERVGYGEATIKAKIEPKGVPTTYRVQWGESDPAENTTGEISVGADETTHTVSTTLSGLAPGSSYVWRLVATNETGPSESAEHGFRTYLPPGPDTCANAERRSGPAAALPDCRAYELVSPLDKAGGDIATGGDGGSGAFAAYKQAAIGGEKITYSAGTAFAGAASAPFSSQYLSSRGAGGWSTEAISAPVGPQVQISESIAKGGAVQGWQINTNLFEAFTADLCSGWERSANETPLTPEGLAGYINLYRGDYCGGGYEALTNEGPYVPLPTPGLNVDFSGGSGFKFGGHSTDLSHQVFAANARLTEEGAENENAQVYDLHDGTLELVSVLPECGVEAIPSCGEANPDNSFPGTYRTSRTGAFANRRSALERAVSEDGSRIFWTSSAAANGGPGRIYVRVDGEETIPVSTEGEELSGEAGAVYWSAAADGSKALFSVGGLGLTGGADLYEFDVDTETTTPIAGGVFGVAGTSEDLGRIYFVSEKALGGEGEEGEPNLFLSEEGTIGFIATLADHDIDEFEFNQAAPALGSQYPIKRATRVTPDGAHLAFASFMSLTGYDNSDVESGEGDLEVYRYDAEADELACASCNPAGVRPQGAPVLFPYTATGEVAWGEVGGRAGGTLPTWEHEHYASRVLSADGNRLYFHSSEALVPADTNGVQDVYQWEAPGSGTCTTAAPEYFDQNEGCVSLISTGKSRRESEFYDASADGRDVFFATAASLDPRDRGLVDVYDARVEGGFPPPPPGPAPCLGDACQSAPQPPAPPSPASAGYEGPGDPRPRRDCRAAGRRAAQLSRRAKRARRAAKRSSSAKQAARMRRRSAQLAGKAKRASRSAKRCRARARREANASRRAAR